MATVEFGDFEWDDEKARSNTRKHGITFEEAATAVVDPKAVFVADEGRREERFKVIGLSVRTRLLLVVIVERGDRDRVVSARRATSREESLYEEGAPTGA